ncbi:hypothetical protein, partial [Escherichia coli]
GVTDGAGRHFRLVLTTQAALAQISGLDANSEVVSEAVTAYKAMQ